MSKEDPRPNQVFVGCPWKTVRSKYENLINDFKKSYPLSFVIVGRGGDQNAGELLNIIKGRLFSSSGAIFDASGGNANVSLEYGMAEAKEIPRAIYITKHKRAKDSKSDAAIISDLAGKKRNEYKQLNGLKKLLTQYAKTHSYTKRFEAFLKKEYGRLSKGNKKSKCSLALKIIHLLDEKDSVRRSDIASELQGQAYTEEDVTNSLKSLHKSRLIRCSEGRYSDVSIT